MINNINKIILLIILTIPGISKACAVCYGAQESPMTDGMNKAVLFLLFVITMVLFGIISVIVFFYRRSKLINQNIGIFK
jgi:heme/copper-type cytochrome/quinol oxidase subunit 2